MNIVQLLKDVMLDASFFLENVALRCRAVQIVSKCHNRRRRSEGGHANQEKFQGIFFWLEKKFLKIPSDLPPPSILAFHCNLNSSVM